MKETELRPSVVEFENEKCPVCQVKVLNTRNVRLTNNTNRCGKCTHCGARFKVKNMELIFLGFAR